MHVRKSIAVLLCAFLGGCATAPTPLTAEDTIPVSALINGVKCELAEFFSGNPQYIDAKWIIAGELELNIVATNTGGADIKAGGLVPFKGASLDLGFGFDLTTKQTRKATLKFALKASRSDGLCIKDGAPDETVTSVGIRDWLEAIEKIHDRGARFTANTSTFALTFAVTRASNANASIKIVPVTVSARASTARDDVQVISISLSRPKDDKPDVTNIAIVSMPGTRTVPDSKVRARPTRGPASVGAPPAPRSSGLPITIQEPPEARTLRLQRRQELFLPK